MASITSAFHARVPVEEHVRPNCISLDERAVCLRNYDTYLDKHMAYSDLNPY